MNISLHALNLHLFIFFFTDYLLLLGRFIASFHLYFKFSHFTPPLCMSHPSFHTPPPVLSLDNMQHLELFNRQQFQEKLDQRRCWMLSAEVCFWVRGHPAFFDSI